MSTNEWRSRAAPRRDAGLARKHRTGVKDAVDHGGIATTLQLFREARDGAEQLAVAGRMAKAGETVLNETLRFCKTRGARRTPLRSKLGRRVSRWWRDVQLLFDLGVRRILARSSTASGARRVSRWSRGRSSSSSTSGRAERYACRSYRSRRSAGGRGDDPVALLGLAACAEHLHTFSNDDFWSRRVSRWSETFQLLFDLGCAPNTCAPSNSFEQAGQPVVKKLIQLLLTRRACRPPPSP